MVPTEDQHHTEGKDLGNRHGKVARVEPTVKHSPGSFRAGLIVLQLSGKHQGRLSQLDIALALRLRLDQITVASIVDIRTANQLVACREQQCRRSRLQELMQHQFLTHQQFVGQRSRTRWHRSVDQHHECFRLAEAARRYLLKVAKPKLDLEFVVLIEKTAGSIVERDLMRRLLRHD